MVVALAGIALVVGAFAGWWVYRGNGLWDDLRRAERDFEVPPQFTQVRRIESGTTGCLFPLVECAGPVVGLIYEVSGGTPEEACAAMVAALQKLGVEAEAGGPDEACVEAPLPRVHELATATARVDRQKAPCGTEVVPGSRPEREYLCATVILATNVE